jgi:hypothetical protein
MIVVGFMMLLQSSLLCQLAVQASRTNIVVVGLLYCMHKHNVRQHGTEKLNGSLRPDGLLEATYIVLPQAALYPEMPT